MVLRSSFHRPPPRRAIWSATAILCIGIALAYSGTLQAPFVYDDMFAIPENPTIRRLWPLTGVLMPQAEGGLTVSGRPVLNLSFAINYAISGTAVWSYHLFNLLLHIGSALAVFGIAQRTLERWSALPPTRFQPTAAFPEQLLGEKPLHLERAKPLHLAFTIAALWALHPMLTQAVTYTVQRAESLMGFFYLLTLYAFVRGMACHPLDDKPAGIARQRWLGASVGFCLLGMGTKEVMATAPLMILLYDRTFLAGSFGTAWRERRGYYLTLAGTWLVLGALVLSTGGNRGGTVGIGTGVPLWAYPLTQFQAICRYLALAAWPHPLVFEYGTFWVKRVAEIAPDAALVLPLLGGTVVALWRRPVLGFLGAWFFVILAPTSLAPGTIQMIVEHRMYLPLVAVVGFAAVSVRACLGRSAWWTLGLIAIALMVLTYRRNNDYRSHLALWTDTVAKRPLNARAHQGLGEAHAELGQEDAAVRQFSEAVQLQPDESRHHYNLGFAVAKTGQLDVAIRHYEQSLHLAPNEPRTHNNLAIALARAGHTDEALRHYAEAERLAPRDPQYPFNHGIALFRIGRVGEAIDRYRAALRLRPEHADAHFNLATALVTSGQLDEALEHYAQALRLDPADNEVRTTYGGALLLANRHPEALQQFHEVLNRAPHHVEARFGEANALARLQRFSDAIAGYEALLRDKPDHANAHFKLANVLIDVGRVAEAASQYEAVIRLKPDDAEAHHNLGAAYARMERWNEARREFETALRLKPDYPDARRHLEQLRAVLGR